MKWRTWNRMAVGLALTVLSPWAMAQSVLHGRISYDAGSTMVKGLEDEDWSHAAVNTLILPGDTLWADEGGSSEVEFSGGSFLRLADGSKMEVASLSPGVQVRAWEGAFYAQRVARSTGSLVVEMPAGTLTVEADATVRLDVVREGGSTISVRWGRATLVGRAGGNVVISEGQRVWLDPGMLPSTPAPFDRTRDDAFDTWNRERSKFLAVGPEDVPAAVGITEPVLGTSDLGRYGEWVYVDSRPYWRPTVVVDYVPYRYGYWSTVPAVGNVWVGNYPFCYTTSHYGRWAHNDRYGWIWSYDRVWSPAWCATLRYNDYYVWAPVDYYSRPVIYGSAGRFNVGGVYFSIGSTTCVPVNYFGHGWNYVRPIYPSLWHDIEARPYQVNIWNINININTDRGHVSVPYNRNFDTVRNYNPPRAIRGPDAFPNRDVQVSSRATALESSRGRAQFASDGGRRDSSERTRVYSGETASRQRDVRLSESPPEFSRATRTAPVSASREVEASRQQIGLREDNTRDETIRGRGEARGTDPRGGEGRGTENGDSEARGTVPRGGEGRGTDARTTDPRGGEARGTEDRGGEGRVTRTPSDRQGGAARTGTGGSRVVERSPRGNAQTETPGVPPRREVTRTTPTDRGSETPGRASTRTPRESGETDRGNGRGSEPRPVEPRSATGPAQTPDRTPSRATVPDRNSSVRNQPVYERTPESSSQGVQRRTYPSTSEPRAQRSAPQESAPRNVAPRAERQEPVQRAPREAAPRVEAPRNVEPRNVAPRNVEPRQAQPRMEAPRAESQRVAPSYDAPSRGSSDAGRGAGGARGGGARQEPSAGSRGTVSRSQR